MDVEIKHNFVLVQIAGEDIERVGSLYFDKSFHPEAHKNVFGIVKSVPQQLLYFKKEIDAIKNEFGSNSNCPVDRIFEIQELTARSMQYDVPIELHVDDTIIFKYQVYFSAYSEGRVFHKGKDILILIPYDMIILAIRNEQIIPINGYVLLEPVIRKYEGALKVEDQEDSQIATISHLGTLVRNYLGQEDTDDEFYRVGDKVCFRKSTAVPVEFQFHRKLETKLLRLHRRNLICRLNLYSM